MAESGDRPRPRRQGTKGRKRAAAILDAALSVLVRDGHAAFSLRSVATAAGIRLGHLQYYFTSKGQLLREAVARELDRRAADVDALAGTSAKDPCRAVPRLIDGLTGAQRDPDAIRLFSELRALAIRDAAVQELMRGYTSRCWRAIVSVLSAANPALRRPSAERRAALLVALLEGLMMFRSPERPRELPLLGLERELADYSARLLDP